MIQDRDDRVSFFPELGAWSVVPPVADRAEEISKITMCSCVRRVVVYSSYSYHNFTSEQQQQEPRATITRTNRVYRVQIISFIITCS